jgi:putative membrane protein
MAHERILVPLVAIASFGLAACAGQSNNPPAQTPADETTTTGAMNTYPAQPAPIEPMSPSPEQPAPVQPMTAAADPGSGSTRSPMDTTPGTSPNAGQGAAVGSQGSSGTPASGEKSLDDGQIVAVVHVADQGEIEQARQAVRKARSERVKQYAQHMVTEHSAAEAKLTAVHTGPGSASQESAVTAQLRSSGNEIMGRLKSASGSDFDRAYIGAQVTEHAQVLDLLDNKLIPQAQNPDLRKALQDIRAKVENHLKMAETIQGEIGQAAQ